MLPQILEASCTAAYTSVIRERTRSPEATTVNFTLGGADPVCVRLRDHRTLVGISIAAVIPSLANPVSHQAQPSLERFAPSAIRSNVPAQFVQWPIYAYAAAIAMR